MLPEQLKELELETKSFRDAPFQPNPPIREIFVSMIPGSGESLRKAALMCYGLGLTNGWWHEIHKPGMPAKEERDFGNIIALLHSEVSEAFEAYRNDDKMDNKVPKFRGRIAELVDLQVRLFDYVASDPAILDEFVACFEAKNQFNVDRPDHKIENRLAAGGKKL